MKNIIKLLVIMALFASCEVNEPTVNYQPQQAVVTPTPTINPLNGRIIRFDDFSQSSVGMTLRNHKGELIQSVEQQAISMQIKQMYAPHIPKNAQLLAMQNNADEIIFEIPENGIKKLKRLKLRGGGKIATLAGVLLATYELLGGEAGIKQSKNKIHQFHFN